MNHGPESEHWMYRRRTGWQLFLLRVVVLAAILMIGIVIPSWFKWPST